mmetsp:Transcript_109248/g.304544  ORF Transcript_109248/g.304544 Transcript_109248/m.304544 type:complete len:806 (+) Transcript_109248:61-2478(+)
MAEGEETVSPFKEEYEQGCGIGPNGMREVQIFRGCLTDFKFNPLVTIGAAVALWGLVIGCLLSENASTDLKAGQSWVTQIWTWLYIGSQDYWLAFIVPLAYYYGHVKLGQDDEEPEYSDLSYFSMVFCAGVAIGLIFWGASETLYHMTDGTNRYNNNGFGTENQKAQDALNVTIYHWGLQAWVVYALTAISMGILAYRHQQPLCFRTTLAPLFGRATWGWLGDFMDVVTIVTIVSGLCTSLGMGAQQIIGGGQRLGWLPDDLDATGIKNAASVAVAGITCVATLSVVSGVNYGVKTLSQIAFILGNFLLMSVFFMDNPMYLLNVLVQGFGYHVQNLIELGFYTDAFAQLKQGDGGPNDALGAHSSWMDWWTIFYWGWWISWAPFVGTFLARISRGRTINNVLIYALTVSFSYSLFWFCSFTGASVRMHQRAVFLQKVGLEVFNDTDHYLSTPAGFRPSGAKPCYDVPAEIPEFAVAPWNTTIGAKGYVADVSLSPVCVFSTGNADGYWFDLMNQYHGMGPFLGTISLITIILYFVSSSDSGSLVVDLIAANGREAHVIQRVFWALSEGMVAIALLQSGTSASSLGAVQAMSIIMGLPFTIIMMLMTTALWRALKIDQGQMLPRSERVDFALPLYGGIFDLVECAMTCGRATVPPASHVKNFFIGFFAPSFLLYQSFSKFAQRQKQASEGEPVKNSEKANPVEDKLMVVLATILYYAFWILHILDWAKVNDGLSGLAWCLFTGFAAIVGAHRYCVRNYYGIQGNPFEDLSAAAFVWPQALAQLVAQVEEEPRPKPAENGKVADTTV